MTDNSHRIAQLEAKLKARKGRIGFATNVQEIEAELRRLKAEQADASRD